MSETWRQEYQKLTEFIGSHPEIVITQEITVTPETSRVDFYALFDKVRETAAEELCPTITEESIAITEAYRKVSAEAISCRYIDDILAEAAFDRFVQDPVSYLARAVIDPLWDLLKGKIQGAAFEAAAQNAIESAVSNLRSLVYQKCVILSMVNFYRPNELYQFEQPKPNGPRRTSILKRLTDTSVISVPLPTSTRQLSWKHDDMPRVILPDLIMRSTVKEKVRYIAVRSRYITPTNQAENASGGREWFSVGPKFTVDSDVILVYEDDNPLAISLVAEAGRMCRPDSFIKYRVSQSQDLNQWLESASDNSEALQPRLGFHLVSRVP